MSEAMLLALFAMVARWDSEHPDSVDEEDPPDVQAARAVLRMVTGVTP